MSAQEDVRFLALLVHRGHLERDEAEPILARLKAGEPLDPVLADMAGWSESRIAKLRRTRAGEEPEVPGYEVLGRVGVGGTADVFRARDKKTGKLFALKILNPRCTRDPRELRAFVEEARLLERLDHPGLVAGHGVAKFGTTYFARMECIDGRTLLELLEEDQQFPEETALRIILECAEVLAYLAEQGLVHRDVKPGNIMLTQDGRTKLIDLGFCCAQDARDPEDSARGTVQYLSPEQAEGGAAADIRSDVYSLGVTLFQLVVGRLPFEGDDDETLRSHVMERLRSPELKSRGLSPHLQYFIEKMMSKDAELRYQSWDELIEDVRGQVEGRASLDYAAARESRPGAPRGRGRVGRVDGRRAGRRR